MANSYWVVPGRFAAGEYPGAQKRREAAVRLRTLLGAGINHFIDLTRRADGLAPYVRIAQEQAHAEGIEVRWEITEGLAGSPGASGDEVELQAKSDGVGTVRGAESREDVLDVGGCGPLRDEQLGRYLGVRSASCDEFQDLAFSGGEDRSCAVPLRRPDQIAHCWSNEEQTFLGEVGDVGS